MSSDNFRHKRKSRREKDFTRRRSSRNQYDRVLIVCEGSKTEPGYLEELKHFLRLSSAEVEIAEHGGGEGSAPISVVRYAKRRYVEEKQKGDMYDKVYCVFDKDTHSTYKQAINECEKFKPLSVFRVINSVPCFEYWLLLHFKYSTKPYSTTNGSACDNLIRDLKKHLPTYTKGTRNLFCELENRTDQAIKRSNQALRAAEDVDTDNPTTRMHELVGYLRHLKN